MAVDVFIFPPAAFSVVVWYSCALVACIVFVLLLVVLSEESRLSHLQFDALASLVVVRCGHSVATHGVSFMCCT